MNRTIVSRSQMVGTTNEEMRLLFLELYKKNDAALLHEYVVSHPLLSDNRNWHPYGNNPSNYSTFENQQSNAIAAFIEKITNSIDAVLLKQCKKMGIEPKGLDAPRTMESAVENFYNVRNLNWGEVTNKKWVRSIAENIQIIASGDRKEPSLTIYDDGEGQHPDDFEKTFLSLHRGNKLDIHFVQGKFNMGSTGAVVFCGGHRYQLIASKRAGELSSTLDNTMGFTLVRRHVLTSEEEESARGTWYEYFAPGGQIPRFEVEEIDLGLYGRKFSQGSIVKMYSYQLPLGSTSNITLDLYRNLNQYLYQPAIPILLYEKRDYNMNTPSKPMLGNKNRILVDDRSKKEKTISLNIERADIGKIPIEVHVFNTKDAKKEYIKEKAVVFSINGQVQGALPRSFISRELKFHMLRDCTLIHVDCTHLKSSFRQDLFMASRDRLKESRSTKELQDIVKEALRQNEELIELNKSRTNNLMQSEQQDQDLLQQVMSTIPVDDDLANLLSKNGDLSFLNSLKTPSHSDDIDADGQEKVKKKPEKDLHPYPAEFKVSLSEDMDGRRVKALPLGGKGVIKFGTDVEDEFLVRPSDPGQIRLEVLSYGRNTTTGGVNPGVPKEVEDVFDVKIEGPNDGIIRISLDPKADVHVGDEIEMSTSLISSQGELRAVFWVKVYEPLLDEGKKEPKKKKEKPSLPIPIKVYKEEWADYDFNSESIVKLIPNAEENSTALIQGIAINMDSKILHDYIQKKRLRSQEQIHVVQNKFFLNVYLHTLFLYASLDKVLDVSKVEIETKDLIEGVFRPYSRFLLSLDTNDAVLNALHE